MSKNFHSQKLYLIVSLISILFINKALAQGKGNDSIRRQCGSEFSYEKLINSSDQSFAGRYRKLDQFTKTYIQTLRQQRKNGFAGDRSSPIVIPVVVHVIYNTAAQNISNAQIQSQIDVLNRDYRKLNSDVSLTPGVFSPLTSDCLIEFKLAVRDPNCMPTNGITRTPTSVTSFSVPSDAQSTSLAFNPIKSTAAGGHDAWPRDKYLNLWVGNLAGSILGYSSFPGFPANVDGVAIDYQYMGTTGTVSAPYNLGRTATHEIGHWLNLFHIWGDDDYAGSPVGPCAGSDQVDDTPNQNSRHFGCPPFPSISCSNGPNGDMFMNYMDYTDDACMYMFTIGQSERMDAALYGERSALLASDGLVPASGVIGSTADIFMQDMPDDIGNEPNTISSSMYQSEDIWTRRQDDGTTNQEYEAPIYRPVASGLPNYVYVRVRNRSCTGASVSGTLKLYWANASTGLSYPSPWDGSVTAPALMGGSIGAGTPVTVPAGGYQIIKFPWYPPNPADYAVFGDGSHHFCLLARIETTSSAPFGMTFPETNNLGENVRNNNNIVWKNISVINEVVGGKENAVLIVGNFSKDNLPIKINFNSIWTAKQQNFLQYGKITIDLGPDLYGKWIQAGKKSFGIREVDKNIISIENWNAWIDGFNFSPKEFYAIHVNFQFTKKIPFGDYRKFEFKVEELTIDKNGRDIPFGGETYIIKSLKDFTRSTASSLNLLVKAVLQGGYQPVNGLMIDSLRAKNILPLSTPYPALNFIPVNNEEAETIDGGVLDITGPHAITDWVWLELRDSTRNTAVISTRSALIRRDGFVVDMDGISPVSFEGIPEGNYYIAIRHRNHLGVMSSATLSLHLNDSTFLDFTNPDTRTYGSNSRKNVNGVMTLWAGDPNRDGSIKYNGAANDKVSILSRVGLVNPNNVLFMYDGADLNLDGMVKYNGALNDKNLILSNVGLTTPSNIITQQLPK